MKEKRKLRLRWIVYLWVFDDRAHRRHMSASQPTLCSLWTILPGCLEAHLSRKSETQQASQLWGGMSRQSSSELIWRKEAISPFFTCLLFFCVLSTWTHLISLSLCSCTGLQWNEWLEGYSSSFVCPSFHSFSSIAHLIQLPCKLFPVLFYCFIFFLPKFSFSTDTFTTWPLIHCHLSTHCSTFLCAYSLPDLILSPIFFFPIFLSSLSIFNSPYFYLAWGLPGLELLNISHKHTLHVLSPNHHLFVCTSHNPLSLLSTFSLTYLTIILPVLPPCSPPRSSGTPPSRCGSTAPRLTSLWEDVQTMRRRISTLSSQTPGWSPSSSPSSCWLVWWATLWLFMSFPNTGRWGRRRTST